MNIFENGKINTKDFTIILSSINNIENYELSDSDINKIRNLLNKDINKVFNNIIEQFGNDLSLDIYPPFEGPPIIEEDKYPPFTGPPIIEDKYPPFEGPPVID